MNETVIKLVNMLFSDTEMTGEAQALRDELLANCRERYDDAIAENKTEDEAIGRVVESLKGMEEVIDSYPKKRDTEAKKSEYSHSAGADDGSVNDGVNDSNTKSDDVFGNNIFGNGVFGNAFGFGDNNDDDDEPVRGPQNEYRFDASGVNALEIDVRGTDIIIGRTEGSQIVVTLSDEAISAVSAARNGDAVRVSSKDVSHRHGSFTWILDLVTSFSSSGEVKIGVPDGCALKLTARSTSGDLQLYDVALTQADMSSTSGEIVLKPMPSARLASAKLNTASGDIHTALAADALKLNTMNGDVRVSGEARELSISSLSGDVKLKCSAQKASIKTVSGDMRWKCPTADIRQIDLNTTSGDARIKLPSELESVHLIANAVSGSARNDFEDKGGESTVTVRSNSVSGDIQILRRDD